MNLKRIGYSALGAIAMGGLGFWVIQKRHRANAPTYREVLVERGDLNTTIQATGTVQPENRLEIKPPIAGRADSVLVVEGQRVRKGQILAWMSSTERAALLDAAHSEGAEEESRWQKLYKGTPIMAPISGTVITRSIEAGQTFTGTDAVLVMSDRLTVKASVDETDIAQIKLKQSATITVDAYPNEKIAARVDQIAFEAKTVSNVTTYTVDVLPDKTPAFMRAGMTANVSFAAESRPNTLMIPSEAIKVEDGTSSVLTRAPSGEPVSTPISIGVTDGKRTEITEGLNEGDVLLLQDFKLKDRSKDATNPFMPTGPKRGKNGPPRPPGH